MPIPELRPPGMGVQHHSRDTKYNGGSSKLVDLRCSGAPRARRLRTRAPGPPEPLPGPACDPRLTDIRLSMKGRALGIDPALSGTVKLTNRHPSGFLAAYNRGIPDGGGVH